MTTSTRSAGRVLQADAGLDGAIAVLFVALAATSPAGAWARPAWLGAPVLLGTAAVLAALATGLLVLAHRPERAALRVLGAGNGVSAAALAIWAAFDDSTLGPALRAALLVVAVGLAVVATAQIRAAARL